jgi:hypothetical protein
MIMTYGCAVDSALGGYERGQEYFERLQDEADDIMRPFVVAMKNIKKAIDGLPMVQADKDTMFCYVCTGLHETSLGEENPDISIGEHIEGYNQAMGVN